MADDCAPLLPGIDPEYRAMVDVEDTISLVAAATNSNPNSVRVALEQFQVDTTGIAQLRRQVTEKHHRFVQLRDSLVAIARRYGREVNPSSLATLAQTASELQRLRIGLQRAAFGEPGDRSTLAPPEAFARYQVLLTRALAHPDEQQCLALRRQAEDLLLDERQRRPDADTAVMPAKPVPEEVPAFSGVASEPQAFSKTTNDHNPPLTEDELALLRQVIREQGEGESAGDGWVGHQERLIRHKAENDPKYRAALRQRLGERLYRQQTWLMDETARVVNRRLAANVGSLNRANQRLRAELEALRSKTGGTETGPDRETLLKWWHEAHELLTDSGDPADADKPLTVPDRIVRLIRYYQRQTARANDLAHHMLTMLRQQQPLPVPEDTPL